MALFDLFFAEYLVIAWSLFTLTGAVVGHLAKGQAFAGAVLGLMAGPIGWLLIGTLNDHRNGKAEESSTRMPWIIAMGVLALAFAVWFARDELFG